MSRLAGEGMASTDNVKGPVDDIAELTADNEELCNLVQILIRERDQLFAGSRREQGSQEMAALLSALLAERDRLQRDLIERESDRRRAERTLIELRDRLAIAEAESAARAAVLAGGFIPPIVVLSPPYGGGTSLARALAKGLGQTSESIGANLFPEDAIGPNAFSPGHMAVRSGSLPPTRANLAVLRAARAMVVVVERLSHEAALLAMNGGAQDLEPMIVYPPLPAPGPTPSRWATDELALVISEWCDAWRKAARNTTDIVIVEYGQLKSHPGKVLAGIIAALGLPPIRVDTAVAEQTLASETAWQDMRLRDSRARNIGDLPRQLIKRGQQLAAALRNTASSRTDRGET